LIDFSAATCHQKFGIEVSRKLYECHFQLLESNDLWRLKDSLENDKNMPRFGKQQNKVPFQGLAVLQLTGYVTF